MLAILFSASAQAQSRRPTIAPVAVKERITIATAHSALSLFVAADDGRLYQLNYGGVDAKPSLPTRLNRQDEFLPPAGDGYISEPALQVQHADGNTSTNLVYLEHQTQQLDPNVSITRIELKDNFYQFTVTVCLRAFKEQDVIEQWTEIHHDEAKDVRLDRYHSASPLLRAKDYFLTQFHGDYKREATLLEEKLSPGIKILDSKTGVRAHRYVMPSILVSVDKPADEESGEVIGGSLCWPGSFQIECEVDWQNRLRVLAGINPFGSAYYLKPGVTFMTPSMLWTWSDHGQGQVSRNFHRWARAYGIRDGAKPRPVLLNNWEATHMDFDERKIVSLFDGARDIGAELFLLDDGWFGNKHPRDADNAGLGDWDVNHKKLPHGLSFLADEAKKRGLGFGIWIEPEMVNPQSELYEQHPEWAISQPHREIELSRNQLVLDLTRPEVQQHAWRCIEQTLSTPGVSYVKWDANRYVTQPGSSYLPPDRQSQLLVDYNVALLDLMKQMAAKFPNVMAMACAGGGGRVDYGTLRNFHSFWPSDNTDPRDRVKIQWGFGHFFPASTIAAHVTRMGNRPMKFTCDVALSGAFGIDRDLSKMTDEERTITKRAVELYKTRLRDVLLNGDLYRLESPYDRPRTALDYVSPDQSRAALFVYQLKDAPAEAVRPRGLDPSRKYHVREVNIDPATPSKLAEHDKTIDGVTLMRDGLTPPCSKEFDSAVIELVSE
jgi:alpha-galactosidase